jgi:two-component system nitrogen regulation sensor histidine kinase NtrY
MDVEALHRVLFNICANAAEALAEREEQAGGRPGRVTLTATRDRHANILRLCIADNGPGLTQTEQDRIFEPYYSRKKGGTGLGLAIARSTVEALRGRITAYPAPDGGTVFCLEFPICQGNSDVFFEEALFPQIPPPVE